MREVSITSSIQAQLNSDFIFSINEAPPGSLFSYLSRSPLHCSGSKGGTSACNVVTVLLSIVNKRLWRQFLCGIYGCLDRAHSTFVR